jgi:hypothetical protein
MDHDAWPVLRHHPREVERSNVGHHVLDALDLAAGSGWKEIGRDHRPELVEVLCQLQSEQSAHVAAGTCYQNGSCRSL